MATRYLENVARLCQVQVSDLGVEGLYEIPAQSRIVEDFILKNALKSGNTISDEFMLFMAEFGVECINRDAETGNVLMELALQRISKGAVLHEAYDLKGALPEKYQQYSAADDADAPMTAACWQFIQNNLRYCVEAMENPSHRHAELILLGLITYLNEDGTTNEGYQWNEAEIGTSVEKAYGWSITVAGIELDFYEIVPALAPYWRHKRQYFRFAKDVVDWNEPLIYRAFANDAAVDKHGNPYFSRRAKFFLKILGLYSFALTSKIRQDMRVLP